jgi:hypothetical protein
MHIEGVEMKLHALSTLALDGDKLSASHYGRFILSEIILGGPVVSTLD